MNAVGKRQGSVLRRALRALDGVPEADRLPRAVHHGARLLLLLLAAGAIFLLFPAPRLPDTAVLEQGVVAPNDVIAEFEFDIPKDEEVLLREQVEAASGVPPVYDRSPAARDSVLAGVRLFFGTVDSLLAATPEPARRSTLAAFLAGQRLRLTPGSEEVLLDPGQRERLRASIMGAVADFYPLGVAPSSLGQGVSAVRVRTVEGAERLVPRDSLLTPDRFFSLAAGRLPQEAGPAAAELQRLILIALFRPSLVYNEQQTEEARRRARNAVDPVLATVLAGEKIVGAHEQIGEREEERLRAYQAELNRRGMQPGNAITLGRAVGSVLYNALVLGIFGALLWFFRRSLYHDVRSVMLLWGLVLSVSAAAALIARLNAATELIPVTFAALIVAVLWDGRLGLSLALLLALLLGGQAPFLGVTASFTAAVGGAAAAFSVKMVERRSKTWVFIAIISLAYAAAAVTIGLMRSRGMHEIALSMGWGIANAVVASLLAIGFLPLLESLTRITTDQTLLELSDLTRNPLLKRLSLEAPGTYAHTINVANLAEAAANAIGANALLARVGAYYHDVGKLVKPQYFIENQPRGRNPHDKLKPSTSSAIIRSHVVEGMRLAEGENVPEAVKRFIPEHHGTQQIAYFYNRARETDPEAPLNPVDFSYPGPKPQSKETAILMLADSVESAAHVLQDPTPVRIREMVDRLVAGKIADGQLDQSPLTLREIDVVRDSLAAVLTGMYHHRIDYPSAPSAPAPEPEAPQPAGAGSASLAPHG